MTKIDTPTLASTGFAGLCKKAQTAEKGSANSIKTVIAPCDTAFATSSPKVGIYIIFLIFSFI
jgi:hypothetical protein